MTVKKNYSLSFKEKQKASFNSSKIGGYKEAVERLKEIRPYTPGRPIESAKREYKLTKICKLASNENPFIPSYLKKVFLSELQKANRYPEADCFYLRKTLSTHLNVKEQQLVFGNGSDELIVLVLRGFTKEGDEVIIGYPTFLIYEFQAKVEGLKIKKVLLKNHRYDLETIAKTVSPKTKIIFIANPDNPHGTYVTHREVEEFLKKIPPSILVFFDEAYYEFAPKADFPKSIGLLRRWSNLVITRTFSKAYALAGLRIGYAITSSQIAEVLNKVREPFNVNRFAQCAAIAALRNKQFLNKVLKHTQQEKQFLYSELDKLGLEYVKSATNFILVNFNREVTGLADYLLKHGVIIRDLKWWGLPLFFRVTIGKRTENRMFIRYLKEYLREVLRVE